LLKDALDTRLKVLRSGIPDQLRELSGATLAIAIQKPFAWEYRLFSQAYSDEITRCSALTRDLQYGVALGRAVRFGELSEFTAWVQTKTSEIQSFVQSADKIVNAALPTAFGPPGQPGNVEEIIYAAQRLGLVYRRLLEWTSEFRHADSEEHFHAVLAIVARASQNVISELEGFSRTLQQEINSAVSRYERTKEPQSLELTLKLTVPDLTDLDAELHKLAEHFGFTY
jgi:hypothetical protein